MKKARINQTAKNTLNFNEKKETFKNNCLKTYFKALNNAPVLRTEYGRSMTEMLGVLAVIGVLSIGGITGFRYGMNKLRANELLNEIDLRRVALYQQLMKDPENIDMELGGTTKQGYKISSLLDAVDEDVFYLSLEAIPTSVCKEILRQNWTAPLEVYVDTEAVQNGDASGCGSHETVDLEFEFDKSGIESDDAESDPENSDTPQTPETTVPEPETSTDYTTTTYFTTTTDYTTTTENYTTTPEVTTTTGYTTTTENYTTTPEVTTTTDYTTTTENYTTTPEVTTTTGYTTTTENYTTTDYTTTTGYTTTTENDTTTTGYTTTTENYTTTTTG